MKILCLRNTPNSSVLYIKPDTSLLRNNNAFFIPNFTKEVVFEAGFVLKVEKMGKCINKLFAHRYYSEIGVAIDFRANDVLQHCIANRLPWDAAQAFDNSFAISPNFVSKEELTNVNNLELKLKINDEVVTLNSSQLTLGFDEVIAEVSKNITLKIGDYLFCGVYASEKAISIDDHFQFALANRYLLDFTVK